MLRSRKEIEMKIEEYRERTRYTRGLALYGEPLLIFMYAIGLVAMIIGLLTHMSETLTKIGIVMTVVLSLIVIQQTYVFIKERRQGEDSRKKRAIAASLEAALRMIEKPDGEQKLIDALDEMIIAKNEGRLKNNGRLQAFTWIASPGGVPGAKEE